MSLAQHAPVGVTTLIAGEFDTQCVTRDGWPTTSGIACETRHHHH
ncbi:hypothetical protein [Burkholderia lata]|nr:hypothetical protein [Burkholderia lata]